MGQLEGKNFGVSSSTEVGSTRTPCKKNVRGNTTIPIPIAKQ